MWCGTDTAQTHVAEVRAVEGCVVLIGEATRVHGLSLGERDVPSLDFPSVMGELHQTTATQ